MFPNTGPSIFSPGHMIFAPRFRRGFQANHHSWGGARVADVCVDHERNPVTFSALIFCKHDEQR